MQQEKICSITGKKFVVSYAEITLREMFRAPLPLVHPYERIRELMAWCPQLIYLDS